MNKPNQGIKHDSEKLRTDLIPTEALEEIIKVLGHGANKYKAWNWEHIEKSRYYAATLRHLFAWWKGEDNDPESGISHLAHAACSIMFMMEIDEDLDDRPYLMK